MPSVDSIGLCAARLGSLIVLRSGAVAAAGSRLRPGLICMHWHLFRRPRTPASIHLVMTASNGRLRARPTPALSSKLAIYDHLRERRYLLVMRPGSRQAHAPAPLYPLRVVENATVSGAGIAAVSNHRRSNRSSTIGLLRNAQPCAAGGLAQTAAGWDHGNWEARQPTCKATP